MVVAVSTAAVVLRQEEVEARSLGDRMVAEGNGGMEAEEVVARVGVEVLVGAWTMEGVVGLPSAMEVADGHSLAGLEEALVLESVAVVVP